jgi:hypothetical protein
MGDWLPKLLILLILVGVSSSGCAVFTRTVYVPDGKAVRLRQDVKGVKVWVKEVGGNTAEGSMTLKEGWYCKSMPQEDVK